MNRIQKPKGTLDILPGDIELWQYIEGAVREEAKINGFSEIRMPTFEATELFCRGVGDTTDVVGKEMYTFTDKDGSSLSLRPEGTAGVARSVIENGLYAGAMPLKLFYLSNFFRREKPQAGRSREFWQFGTELYGSSSPEADAQVILLANGLFKRLGLTKVTLRINSIGCPECRPSYRKALLDYFANYESELCDTCRERLNKNPLRVLDCKSPVCSGIAKNAPKTLEHLCAGCESHFEKLKELLDLCGVEYTVDPSIVRGLDYYTGTVFEFTVDSIGAQSTVCGGGRYDGLLASIGGPSLPAVGFGMGITRLIQALKDESLVPELKTGCDIYIAPLGEAAGKQAFLLAHQLREKGVSAETDVCGRSLKAQMKYADKAGARYVLVVGDNEIAENSAELRNMQGGERIKVSLSTEDIIDLIAGK
ncbi:MAG: histidine--tRNA ligase [Clostridia bacterium]|nr:histidine--tRNA ligase [Clostridia bacterium]